jgi:hypothetical protein
MLGNGPFWSGGASQSIPRQTFQELIPKTLDFLLLAIGTVSAMGTTVIQPKVDRRVIPDRRAHPRGGRRIEDHNAPASTAQPCDDCESREVLFLQTTRGYDEYRCRRCRCRLFRLRSL